MAYERIERAYPQPELRPPVSHRFFDPSLWTGTIELVWQIPENRPVVIGSGRLVVEAPPPAMAEVRYEVRKIGKKHLRVQVEGPRVPPPPPKLIAEVARCAGLAVLPGSSLKGAVRQVYELLTKSCPVDVVKDGERKPRMCSDKPRGKALYCPACSLFGGASLGGRLNFGEAKPVRGAARLLAQVPVPTPWSPSEKEAVAGWYRVYDLGRAWNPERNEPQDEVEATRGACGEFRSQIQVMNASADELGVFFLSLGLGAPSPGIRLGAKKFHGLGAADVTIGEVKERFAGRHGLEGRIATAWAGSLATWALADPARRRAWEDLHRVIARLEVARA